jgi:hypothetical protein
MAYSDQALLAQDIDFALRTAAAASTEGLVPVGTQATLWAADHIWRLSAAPGFAADYASALAAGIPRPGNDESVISDAELLSAIQALPPDPT